MRGFIDVPEGLRAAVRAALPEHIALTRAEAGCLSFEVAEDPAQPGRFQVSEVFASEACFQAHQLRTQSSDWARITEGIARHYKISRGTPA